MRWVHVVSSGAGAGAAVSDLERFSFFGSFAKYCRRKISWSREMESSGMVLTCGPGFSLVNDQEY